MKRVLVLRSLIATYLVFGGSSVEANNPRATQLTYEPWTKICLGNSNCFVATGARGKCDPSGGGLSISMLNGENVSLSARLMTRRMLEGPMSIQIDQSDPISIPNPECRGLGCAGKFEIDSEFIEYMKRSRTITIEATDTARQKLSLSFSLADFSQAYDGPGTEPQVFEESQEKLKELLRQRAEKDQPPPQCED
jgi:invasion protein IalB